MSSSSSESILIKLDQIEIFYQNDKLLKCGQLLREVRTILNDAKNNDNNSKDDDVDTKRAVIIRAQERLNTEPIRGIAAECAQVDAFKISLKEDNGWTLSYDGAETKVWYKREEGTASHSIRIKGMIRAPLINIAALLYESDLYKQLFWYITESNNIPVVHESDFKRAAHITVYVPWPLNDRDVALYAIAVDALDDDGSVTVVSRSICDNDPIQNGNLPPPPLARVTRAHFHNSGFELRPQSPGITAAHFLYNVDPRLNFIPMPLINWGARTMCRWSLRMLEARARDLLAVSPEYDTRMASAPVYNRMRSRLTEYWTVKGVPFDPIQGPDIDSTNGSESRPSATFNPDDRPEVPNSLVKTLIAAQQPDLSSMRKRISGKLFGSQSRENKTPRD